MNTDNPPALTVLSAFARKFGSASRFSPKAALPLYSMYVILDLVSEYQRESLLRHSVSMDKDTVLRRLTDISTTNRAAAVALEYFSPSKPEYTALIKETLDSARFLKDGHYALLLRELYGTPVIRVKVPRTGAQHQPVPEAGYLALAGMMQRVLNTGGTDTPLAVPRCLIFNDGLNGFVPLAFDTATGGQWQSRPADTEEARQLAELLTVFGGRNYVPAESRTGQDAGYDRIAALLLPGSVTSQDLPEMDAISKSLPDLPREFKKSGDPNGILSILAQLRPGGKAALLLPRLTEAARFAWLRRYLVENHHLAGVYSLPWTIRLIPGSHTTLSLWLLQRGTASDVRLWPAGALEDPPSLGSTDPVTLSPDRLYQDQRCSLDFDHWKYLGSLPHQGRIIPLEKLAEIRRGLTVPALKDDGRSPDETGSAPVMRLIRITDLSSLPLSTNAPDPRNLFSGRRTEIKPQTLNDARIMPGDILLPRNALPCRAVLVSQETGTLSAEEEEACRNNSLYLLASGNIFIIRPRDPGQAYLLLAYFNSHAGQRALTGISVSSTVTLISIGALKELALPESFMHNAAAGNTAAECRRLTLEILRRRLELEALSEKLSGLFDDRPGGPQSA